MLQVRSYVNVADNSGATLVGLFAVNGKNGKRFARVGDIVACSVKRSSSTGKIKKGQKVYGVIVRTRKEINRKDGSSIKFSDNAVVLINPKTKDPIGSRVFGPVSRELRDLGYSKIISLAEEVL
jgi:large subunit ribosomal protein L14